MSDSMKKVSALYEEDYDRLLYGEEEEEVESEEVATCARHEIGLFLVSLSKTVVEALNAGVKIVIDVEPVQYESALSLLAHAVSCSPYWRNAFTLRDRNTNTYLSLRFTMFTLSKPGAKEIVVSFVREKKKDELMRELESIITLPRIVYFIITPKKPEIEVTSALYKTNVILNAVKNTLLVLDKKYGNQTKEFREKIKYVGRVPHEVVLLMPLDIVKSVARSWTPPPPANADYLREKPRRIKDLVLPPEFKRMINQYLKVIRAEGKGSIMLIGLHGSGRKTLARAIAEELGLPAYVISIANILSRYVGESEGKLKSFFESLRARGGLAVFDSVDALFRKSGAEQVTSNLKSILFQEMAREDNNFVIVFTTTEDAPSQVFDSPLLGEVKFVMPLPDREERRVLARQFFHEISGPFWDKLLNITSRVIKTNNEEKTLRALYSLYADIFVDACVGFTPGEMYQVMKTILIPTISEIIQKENLIPVANLVLEFTKRDYAARQARIKQLIDKAISLGWFQIAERLNKINDELSKIARESMSEMSKYKK